MVLVSPLEKNKLIKYDTYDYQSKAKIDLVHKYEHKFAPKKIKVTGPIFDYTPSGYGLSGEFPIIISNKSFRQKQLESSGEIVSEKKQTEHRESQFTKPSARKTGLIQELDKALSESWHTYKTYKTIIRDKSYQTEYEDLQFKLEFEKNKMRNDANELKTIIDGLIAFDGYKRGMFTLNKQSHQSLFKVIDGESKLDDKLDSYFQLLVIAKSVIPLKKEQIYPKVRAPQRPGLSTFVGKVEKPNVEQTM